MARLQHGFSIVTAIFLVVVLALLGAFIISVTGLQQSGVVQDLLGSRAYQAARAGIEWGAFRTIQNNTCAATALTFTGTVLDGFTTTVACTRTAVNEGGTTVNVDEYTSTACNQPPCPAGAPGKNYSERRLRIVVSR